MLIFIYGANMASTKYSPNVRFIGKAMALDHKLVFSGSNEYWGHQGYASLRYYPYSPSKAYGLLYQIDFDGISFLDVYDTLGLPSKEEFIKAPIRVTLFDEDNELQAYAFVQAKPKLREPTPDYYAKLKSIYARNNFPLETLSEALLDTRR